MMKISRAIMTSHVPSCTTLFLAFAVAALCVQQVNSFAKSAGRSSFRPCTNNVTNEVVDLTAECGLPHIPSVTASAPPAVQEKAVRDLVERLLPRRAAEFIITVDPTLGPTHHLTFSIQTLTSTNGSVQVSIAGTSGVAAAGGVNHYLKYFCHAHISWSGDQLKLPMPLPELRERIVVTSRDTLRYYQNVCTSSYTFVWWNWTRWEREIDWMALNSINLPLAFTGQEEIWYHVFTGLGFNETELADFFTGPAFLAWGRMGNIQGWGGPLPRSWMKAQFLLQRKIVERMREFGMTPVLPGFAGYVPRATKERFPQANVSVLDPSGWGHFYDKYCCTLFLDPLDPLFTKIGSSFIREMKDSFGVDHIYNADPLNEMVPTSRDPIFLANIGKSVYKSMTVADPNAIWLVQGWMFYSSSEFWKPKQAKAFLTSVPQGKMLVLDLQAELFPQYRRLESFYGQPFIWCMLHNYGGVLGMYGAINQTAEGPSKARMFPNSTLVGTGATPEGILQNDVMYDLLYELGWMDGVNLTAWVQQYAWRRYGMWSQPLVQAWHLLASTVYNCQNNLRHHGKYVIVLRPSLKRVQLVWYDVPQFLQAWDVFVSSADALKNVSTFRYDLVDTTRQALQLIAAYHYTELVGGYRSWSIPTVQKAGRKLLLALDNLELILGTNEKFLLGSWLEAAKSLATNDQERVLYEYNARVQVTLWGPDGNILDYGKKQWAGLVSHYYRPRWQLFVDILLQCLSTGKHFNQTAYNEDVFRNVERPFTFARNSFPIVPTGDSVVVAKQIHAQMAGWRSNVNTEVFTKMYTDYENWRLFLSEKDRFTDLL
ncbi:PREDICTED: alpha-N-acetylglucosaminidase-like [Priapulus caudatus]|uniref:Alpha-N-acetylglucosaminidase-like n=1 Tax=Priapulus caudatus TaxID=37621 RepID=A0ABM1DTM3_PRICU|nr:PREDICTED: alpha-N-acetylglucosaminidase-like [Priapulus caudatus]